LDVGADLGGAPQGRRLLQEAINSRLLQPLQALPLLPLKFDLVLPYLLLGLGLSLYPPFELPHPAFPVLELGYRDDLDRDVRHLVLDRRDFGILSGRALPLALITLDKS
jgi:hypothetical protein